MTPATTSTIEIRPIVIPETLEDDHDGVIAAIQRIGNAAARYEAGTDDLDESAEEIFASWHDRSDYRRFGFFALRDGDIQGIASMFALNEGADVVQADLLVDPDHWSEDVADALLDAMEREARRMGRLTLQGFTLHRGDTPGPRLEAPTGFGSIPADDRQTRIMLGHGFTLGQVERNSAFDLSAGPYEHVAQLLDAAIAKAGPDYRLLEWTCPTPDEYVDGFAAARARLTTDMPAGELSVEEETWDADRIRRREARFAAMGMTVSVTAVQHVPTGVIAAYNDIGVLAPDAVTHQFGTLVLPEHRGHRLGMIVKCANILRWRDIAPGSPKISTFNAEENAHMLAINVEIGFRPVSYVGAWKKVLTPGA